MKQLLSLYRESSPRTQFLVHGAALVIFWKTLELTGFVGLIHPTMTAWLVDQSVWVLETAGYQTSTSTDQGITYIGINGQPSVLVGDGCNGLTSLLLFTAFIILTRGPWITKLLFSILGLAIIHVANVIRVAALAHGYIYYRVHFDFNHNYLYAMMVYALIFILWMVWILINREPKESGT